MRWFVIALGVGCAAACTSETVLHVETTRWYQDQIVRSDGLAGHSTSFLGPFEPDRIERLPDGRGFAFLRPDPAAGGTGCQGAYTTTVEPFDLAETLELPDETRAVALHRCTPVEIVPGTRVLWTIAGTAEWGRGFVLTWDGVSPIAATRIDDGRRYLPIRVGDEDLAILAIEVEARRLSVSTRAVGAAPASARDLGTAASPIGLDPSEPVFALGHAAGSRVSHELLVQGSRDVAYFVRSARGEWHSALFPGRPSGCAQPRDGARCRDRTRSVTALGMFAQGDRTIVVLSVYDAWGVREADPGHDASEVGPAVPARWRPHLTNEASSLLVLTIEDGAVTERRRLRFARYSVLRRPSASQDIDGAIHVVAATDADGWRHAIVPLDPPQQSDQTLPR